jgi:hypothetical protein
MPGVFEVSREVSIRAAVDDILLITQCSKPGEWNDQVRYLPLRRDTSPLKVRFADNPSG